MPRTHLTLQLLKPSPSKQTSQQQKAKGKGRRCQRFVEGAGSHGIAYPFPVGPDEGHLSSPMPPSPEMRAFSSPSPIEQSVGHSSASSHVYTSPIGRCTTLQSNVAKLREAAQAHEAAAVPRLAELRLQIAKTQQVLECNREKQNTELARLRREYDEAQKTYEAALQQAQAQLSNTKGHPDLRAREEELLHAITEHRTFIEQQQAVIAKLQLSAESLKTQLDQWDDECGDLKDQAADIQALEQARAQCEAERERIQCAIAHYEKSSPELVKYVCSQLDREEAQVAFNAAKEQHKHTMYKLEDKLQRTSPSTLQHWKQFQKLCFIRRLIAAKEEELRDVSARAEASQWVEKCRAMASNVWLSGLPSLCQDVHQQLASCASQLKQAAAAARTQMAQVQEDIWYTQALMALLKSGGQQSKYVSHDLCSQMERVAHDKARLATQIMAKAAPAVWASTNHADPVSRRIPTCGDAQGQCLPNGSEATLDKVQKAEAEIVSCMMQGATADSRNVSEWLVELGEQHKHLLRDLCEARQAVYTAMATSLSFDLLLESWSVQQTHERDGVPLATCGDSTTAIDLHHETKWLQGLRRHAHQLSVATQIHKSHVWRQLEEEEQRWMDITMAHQEHLQRSLQVPEPSMKANSIALPVDGFDMSDMTLSNDPKVVCRTLLQRQRCLNNMVSELLQQYAAATAAKEQQDAAAYTRGVLADAEATLAVRIPELQLRRATLDALQTELACVRATTPDRGDSSALLERLCTQRASLEAMAARINALENAVAEVETSTLLETLRELQNEADTLELQRKDAQRLLAIAEQESAGIVTRNTAFPFDGGCHLNMPMLQIPVPSDEQCGEPAHSPFLAPSTTPKVIRNHHSPEATRRSQPNAIPEIYGHKWLHDAKTGRWRLFGPSGPSMSPTEAVRFHTVVSQLVREGTPVRLRRANGATLEGWLLLTPEIARLETRLPGKRVAESFVRLEQVTGLRSSEAARIDGARPAAARLLDGYPFSVTFADRAAVTFVCLDKAGHALWVEVLPLIIANKPNLVFLRYALKAMVSVLDKHCMPGEPLH